MAPEPDDLDLRFERLRREPKTRAGEPPSFEALENFGDGALPAEDAKALAGRIVEDPVARARLARVLAADAGVEAIARAGPGEAFGRRPAWRVWVPLAALAATVVIVAYLFWPKVVTPVVDLTSWSIEVAEAGLTPKAAVWPDVPVLWPPLGVKWDEDLRLSGGEGVRPALVWLARRLDGKAEATHRTAGGLWPLRIPLREVLNTPEPGLWIVAMCLGEERAARGLLTTLTTDPSVRTAASEGAQTLSIAIAEVLQAKGLGENAAMRLFVLEVLP
jgi:hypothetical protein